MITGTTSMQLAISLQTVPCLFLHLRLVYELKRQQVQFLIKVTFSVNYQI